MYAEFKWVVENFGNILLIIICFFTILGVIVESIARLIPTKTPDSALTRLGTKMGSFGHTFVELGKSVRALLDFIKFPNNIKK